MFQLSLHGLRGERPRERIAWQKTFRYRFASTRHESPSLFARFDIDAMEISSRRDGFEFAIKRSKSNNGFILLPGSADTELFRGEVGSRDSRILPGPAVLAIFLFERGDY